MNKVPQECHLAGSTHVTATNQSEQDISECQQQDVYDLARFVTGIFIYPIICAVGLTGNSMALVVLSRPAMLTSYNVILGALAANDVIKLLNDLIYFVDVILQHVNQNIENVLFGHVYPVSHYIFNQVALPSLFLVRFMHAINKCEQTNVMQNTW